MSNENLGKKKKKWHYKTSGGQSNKTYLAQFPEGTPKVFTREETGTVESRSRNACVEQLQKYDLSRIKGVVLKDARLEVTSLVGHQRSVLSVTLDCTSFGWALVAWADTAPKAQGEVGLAGSRLVAKTYRHSGALHWAMMA